MQQLILSKRKAARVPSRFPAAISRSPVLPRARPFAPSVPSGVPERNLVMLPPDLMAERRAKEDLKWYLMNKYRSLLTDRLTRADLGELQYCLRQQETKGRGWNREYCDRFLRKIRGYVGEEILKREITGIESLLTLIRPEDLDTLREENPPVRDRNDDPGRGIPLKVLR